MRRWLFLLWLAPAALAAFVWHQRYWRWRDCFNELGRCYVPEEGVVYLEQSGAVYAGLAAIFLAPFVLGLVRRLLYRRRVIP